MHPQFKKFFFLKPYEDSHRLTWLESQALTTSRPTSTPVQLGNIFLLLLQYVWWISVIHSSWYVSFQFNSKGLRIFYTSRPMKHFHISQRSGNFGGRKKREAGDATEVNEEVSWVHVSKPTIFLLRVVLQRLFHNEWMFSKPIWQVPSIMESGSGALQWVTFLR